MFELKTIYRFIIPRKGEISSSLMSFISLFIITLVTWLSLVFLSVADGIERGWVQRLTSIHGPLKIVPTEAYHSSYYNKIDLYKYDSDYRTKSLREKRASVEPLEINAEIDEELPEDFPTPIMNHEGKPVDLLKKVFSIIEDLKTQKLVDKADEYEITGAMMRLRIFSKKDYGYNLISQASYIMSYDSTTIHLLPEPVAQKTHYTPIFLPKSFQDGGAKIHDVGQLTIYNGFSTATVEENNPFEIVGFYDAGTLQIGPKCLFAPYAFVSKLRSQGQLESTDPILTSGIRLKLFSSDDALNVASKLKEAFEAEGLSPFFDIVPYTEYGFVKEILLSFKSDKILYSIIALLVLVVAASNIVSVLLLIVHQSRKEIALLTALGASKRSLKLIYSGLGFTLGSIGSILGLALAFITMKNLPAILQKVHIFQGYENLFSQSVPTTLSPFSLLVVLIGTPMIAWFAGWIPAYKATRYKPSELLRSL